MNSQTSTYLDMWRLSAALAVFFGHLSGARFTGGFLWQFDPFMGEAVAVFFVLSGFVIGYATDRKERTGALYSISRLARIYSVALPALVMTFLLDAIGRTVRPGLYGADWGYLASGRLWQFVSGLLFLNQAWGLDVPQGSDLPYWSLGYEVWYYIVFGLAMFAPRGWRIGASLVALAAAGPAIAAMLPLWLLGLAGYKICVLRPPAPLGGWALYVGSPIAWAGYQAWGSSALATAITIPVVLKRAELPQDYLVGALFIAHVIGFHAVSGSFAPLMHLIARPVRWAAGATFTVYLLHLPIAQFLAAWLPWPPASWATRLVLLGGTLATLFLVAELTERRKDVWRRAFTAAFSRLHLI